MTPSDDILDLLGRYATGSLTEEERQRLFDAALSDQQLFEELAREQEIKMLLDEPGARQRIVRALEPPRRKSTWIFGVAATAALSVAMMIILLRPSPKPSPVTVARVAPPAPVVQTAIAPPPAPSKSEASSRRDSALEKSVRSEPAKNKAAIADQPANDTAKNDAPTAEDAVKKDAVKKEAVQAPSAPPASSTSQTVEVTAAPAQVQQFAPAQQGAVGGTRQIVQQSRALKPAALVDRKTAGFGFHYSIATKGHLIIVPAADGYLFVKSGDGTVLFSRKQIAAAIKIDVPLPDAVDSVTVTFSATDSQVQTTPIARTEPEGVVDGGTNLAIQLKINP
jgi:hypothetical protein